MSSATKQGNVEFKILDCILHHEPIIQYEEDSSDGSDSGDMYASPKDQVFVIQVFGIDSDGKTYSIFINEFQPFFFVKVGDHWTQS